MQKTEEIIENLYSWAPELVESLTSLAFLGSKSSVRWLTESPNKQNLDKLFHVDGHIVAADMWYDVLKKNKILPTPAILLILEHQRRNPAATASSMSKKNLDFSKTLANVAFRAADSLYEEAKHSFAGDEIDVAIARFRTALSEFRFSIESRQLSDKTKRIATGKYATAVAMIGRWINVTQDVLSRALEYSNESMELGNKALETLTYRLELLVLQFDQTGEAYLLHQALELLSANQDFTKGTELAEAEARFRLAQLSGMEPTHLKLAKSKLGLFEPKTSVEEARCCILNILVSDSEEGRIALAARSMAIPRGLLALMATEPSIELWEIIRRVINGLENLRLHRHSAPAAVLSARFLRQMVDGPDELLIPEDLTCYVTITDWLSQRASWNRHAQWAAGAAALSAAKRTGDKTLAVKAQNIFETLVRYHSTWPLPLIGIARVRDYLAGSSNNGESQSSNHWGDAATLALNSAVYSRSNLGGRNEVFAVADARGFLSETFVFKRTTKEKAEHEASMLGALRTEIIQQRIANRFEVPRSLAIVEVPGNDERRWVHVSQRASGRLVSELRTEDATNVLDSIVDLLAIFHRVAGNPPAGKSAWRPLKDYLKMWSRTLFEPTQADHIVESLRSTFPNNLPLVRKRDGHASNWLVDPAGRIVAIDLESSEFVPIGYDVAQLIEDNALIQANLDGWNIRLAAMTRYLGGMGKSLSESDLSAAYSWFALTRALRLGTEREAGKHLRRHARELCGLVVECGHDTIKNLARELLQALSRIEQSDTKESSPSHDHRRLSKSMAYQLRHNGPKIGVPIDNTGFASMDELARALNVDSSNLLAVAEHPGEPRFEVKDGRIRALYGHSLEVSIDVGIKVGAPTSLYHGSSWSALNLIIKQGLIPMRRRVVHLTNVAEEAIAVGERKGAPIVLEIKQSNNEEPVAEGIWIATTVIPNRLSIVNPFMEEAGMVR